MTDFTDDERTSTLLSGLLASWPTDGNQLIPTPAQPGLINIDNVFDNQGVHTGPVDNFGFTDDLTPTLSGNPGIYAVGSIVQICINTDLVGSAVVNSDGIWTFTPPQPLDVNQEYIFQTVVQDPGSKQFLISLPYTLYTTSTNGDIPAMVSLDSVVDDVVGYEGFTGALTDGGLTNDAHPALSGHATAGAVVNIYDNGILLASTTAAADGTWRYTPTTALTDGTHNLSVTAVNTTGESQPATFSIVVDTTVTKPVVEFATDDQGQLHSNVASGGLTDDSRPVLHGYAEPNSRVDIHVFGPNGNQLYYQSVHSAADGSWSYQPQAFTTYGKYSFGVSSVDAAGNAWYDYGTKFTLNYVGSNQDDNTGPTVPTITDFTDNVGSSTGNQASGTVTDDSTPTLNGHAEAGSIVKVYEGATLLGSTTTNSSGDWSFTPSARADGKHTFTATATDNAGNTSEPTVGFVVSIDTPPGQASIISVYDDVGPDTGNVANGGTTDDATVTITGHATAGSMIYVYDNGAGFATEYADDQGVWTTNVPARSDGEHIFSAREVKNGITGAESNRWEVNVQTADTTAPNAPTITSGYDDVGTFTGSFTSGTTTDDTTPELRGTAEANSTVKIYDGGTLLGSVTANSSGNWSYTPPARAEGSHNFTATATDAAGNASRHSGSFVVNIDIPDTTAARIEHVIDDVGTTTGEIRNGGITDDRQPDLSGSAAAGSTVTIHQYDPYTHQEYVLGTVIANNAGHWEYSLTGGQVLQMGGESRFWITTLDNTGNTATSPDFIVTLVGSNQDDTTAPDVPRIDTVLDDEGVSSGVPSGGTTDDTTPLLVGLAEAGSVVTIYDLNTVIGSTTAIYNGAWSFEVPTRNEGIHIFTATATDAAGNISGKSAGYVVTVDVPEPGPGKASIINVYDDVGPYQGDVANGGTTDDASVTITGHATAGSTVYVYDNGKGFDTVYADAQGVWTSTVPARSDGEHIFTAREVKNNVTGPESNSWEVNVLTADTTAPHAPSITSGYDNVGSSTGIFGSGTTTDDATPELRGTAEANSIVKIYDGSTLLGSVTANSSGNWSYTTPTRNDGSHTFTATATDAAGNTSGHSGNFVVTVDVPKVFNHESFEGAEVPTHFYNLTTNTGVHISSSAGLYRVNTAGVLEDGQMGTHILSAANTLSDQAINVSLPGASEVVTVNLLTTNIGATRCYDANGQQVQVTIKDVGGVPDLTLHRYEFTATDGHEISSFTVYASNIDTIRWEAPSTTYSTTLLHQEINLQHAEYTPDDHGSTAMLDISNATPDTLHLTLNDILSEAHDNLFVQDGHKQLAVTGDVGDVVELKVEDLAQNTWQDAGQVTAGGVQYEVYHHTGSDVELLVQQGLELHQVS